MRKMFTLTFNTKLDYPKMEVFSLGKQLKINCFNLKIFKVSYTSLIHLHRSFDHISPIDLRL